jgi:hypothetical protein
MALVGIKNFISALLFVYGLMAAGGANATSVTWTIPNTPLTGTNNSVSGSFAWDAVNQVVSNIRVTVVLGGTSTLLTSSSANPGGATLVLNRFLPSNGDPVVGINILTLTNTATSMVVSPIVGGYCVLDGINCGSGSVPVGFAYNVTLTGAPTPPAPSNTIPTLSEWAQIMMMLAMIVTAGLYGWRMKQR